MSGSLSLAPGGLLRSVAHRLIGSSMALSDEGTLAPFDGATGWLNSEPLMPEGLRGRVVLVDFWTYTCINWLRTLPYVRAWADKYADTGLTVVGVHTPEFGFEHDRENVIAQSAALGVTWPIALDNDYRVWTAFGNSYWPAIYLADGDGRIRYHHFGEGEYAQTEMAIQQLLVDAGATDVDMNLVMVEPQGLEVAAGWPQVRSGETYIGYGQASGFANGDDARFDEAADYTAPSELSLNTWALDRTWTVTQYAAVSNAPAGRVAFQFHARDLNLVMGPLEKGTSIPFQVFLDRQPAVGAYGTDVGQDGNGVVDAQRTYQLIRQTDSIEDRRFEIVFGDAGAEVYCFTFG